MFEFLFESHFEGFEGDGKSCTAVTTKPTTTAATTKPTTTAATTKPTTAAETTKPTTTAATTKPTTAAETTKPTTTAATTKPTTAAETTKPTTDKSNLNLNENPNQSITDQTTTAAPITGRPMTGFTFEPQPPSNSIITFASALLIAIFISI